VSQALVNGSSAGTDQISLALETAIIESDMALCDLLIGEGQSLKGFCRCGCSPVLKAFESEFLPLAKFLIDKGASLDGVVPCLKSSFFGFTPLHYAALSGDAEMTLKILSMGCNYESQPVQPIHIAALNGHTACVEHLCNTENSKTVIEAKSMDPSLSAAPLARLVLKTGFQVEEDKAFGKTALHFAASKDHVDTIEVLLAAAADPNSRDETGYTPLHEAVSGNHVHAARILIAAGADIDAAGHNGYSPIMVAAKENSSELTKLLASLGADLTHREQNGMDVLHIAADFKSVDVMEILVDLGVDIQTSDYYGNTAVMLAILNGIEDSICVRSLPEFDTSCHSLYGNLLNEAAYNGCLEIATK
jgi:ankyrin repeat protein